MKVIPADVNGTIVLIEVLDEGVVAPVTGAEGFARAADVTKELSKKVQEIADTAASVCSDLSDRLLAALADRKPTELTLEFGLAIGGEAGFPVVTKVAGEATFKVSATWTAADVRLR
jgi:hypothetical protein